MFGTEKYLKTELNNLRRIKKDLTLKIGSFMFEVTLSVPVHTVIASLIHNKTINYNYYE